MSVLPKMIYWFNVLPFKIPPGCFCRYRQDYSTTYIEDKRTRIDKNNFDNDRKAGGFSLPDFKTDLITVINIVWYWWRNRHIIDNGTE